ncbi:MAG: GspMb/PilO family protein [bacterium]|nr:GspMb/PilO family protein [bacterium]MDD5353600.1 GspMb/PilO family protein [bacterium]MDD5755864.1 GspMb/PilO family protein [bacterium]
MILKKREKVISVICLATVVAATLYNLILEPAYKKWSVVNEEINAKKLLLEKSRALLRKKEVLQKDLTRLQSATANYGNIEQYAAKVLWQLEKLSQKVEGVQITSFTPLPVKDEKDYQILEIQVNFDSSINGLVKFVYNLTKTGYLLNIERLQIDNNFDTPAVLKNQVLVSTVFMTSGEKK